MSFLYLRHTLSNIKDGRTMAGTSFPGLPFRKSNQMDRGCVCATQTNHKHSASDSTITLRPISISLSHLLFILFTFLQFLWANRRGRWRWRLRRLPGGVSKSNKDTKDNKVSSSGMVKDMHVNISIKIIPKTIEGICLIATLRLCWNGELVVEVVYRGKFMQLEINIMFMLNVSLCDWH